MEQGRYLETKSFCLAARRDAAAKTLTGPLPSNADIDGTAPGRIVARPLGARRLGRGPGAIVCPGRVLGRAGLIIGRAGRFGRRALLRLTRARRR